MASSIRFRGVGSGSGAGQQPRQAGPQPLPAIGAVPRRASSSGGAPGSPPYRPTLRPCQAGLRTEQTAAATQPPAAGASTDLVVIYKRLAKLALPYWTDPEVGGKARWSLVAVVGLTLATTGVSVLFNFLGRDFFNALSEKNEDLFGVQLMKYLGAFVVGIPVFVFKSFVQEKVALEWRAWMTQRMMDDYFAGRTFYSLQAQAGVDNPDQRMSSDVMAFTGTALNLSLVLLNASIDLISFSGILYSIYPPLFAALIAYSVSGSAISLWLGKPLVGLNFAQEAREADLRYGLVRVRENAEAVAFYRGEEDEKSLLKERLKAAVANYLGLLVATRNLDFFTSFYRYLIQLLPAAVVAPLFFQGKIEFGVINQSQSAFNHVLNDLSLVVYQFESLAGFSAVIDRLGQFKEAMDGTKALGTGSSASAPASQSAQAAPRWPGVTVRYQQPGDGTPRGGAAAGAALLELAGLTVVTPNGGALLVQDLNLTLTVGGSLLIMGPSGAGKTSIMRTLAGLWSAGAGSVDLACAPNEAMFLPQKPYMVLGSLRDQVLYPTYAVEADRAVAAVIQAESGGEEAPVPTPAAPPSLIADEKQGEGAAAKPAPPPDEEVIRVLRQVRLGHLLARYAPAEASVNGAGSKPQSALDAQVDWASSLSLGEQQRVAWARLLLANPRLALLDEASSALDQATEEELYELLAKSGITYVSVAHRSTLRKHHRLLLQLAPSSSRASDDNVGGSSGGSEVSMDWELLQLNPSTEPAPATAAP